MLFFGKKKKDVYSFDLGWLKTDMHSHLLPGIDDGSPDLKTSVELVKGLQNLGYKKLVTTPHIFWELYPNTPAIIDEALMNLRMALDEEGIEMEISAAAEYYMDEHFEAALRNKTPLLPIGGNKVLVEFSMVTAPMDLLQVLFEMQIQGYQPVIAHPERYAYLAHRKDFFDELRNAGCFFQLNLLSLIGYYGKQVQELAEFLCKKDYYDFAGTDLHHERHLNMLKKLASSATIERLREARVLKNPEL